MRRALACLGLVAVLVATLVSPPRHTRAHWADVETGAGQFAAMVVPKPIILGCNAWSFLGGYGLELTWRYASTDPAPTRQFFYGSSANVLTVQLAEAQTTTTGPVDGIYTTRFSTNVLNGVLGGTGYAGVRAIQSGWQSAISTVRAAYPIALGSGTCTVT